MISNDDRQLRCCKSRLQRQQENDEQKAADHLQAPFAAIREPFIPSISGCQLEGGP
jgi:hypothetical protein